MGRMIDGAWHAGKVTEDSKGGAFERQDAGFRDWLTPVGSPGHDGQPGRPATPGRYHLYVSYACPWAHRTLIVRALHGLEDAIGVSVVDPVMLDNGWTFGTSRGGSGDPLHDAEFLWQLYARARPDYSGKVTVPVLWDRETDTIVSNESADIIRMLAAFAGSGPDLYPQAQRQQIDEVNARVYDTVNNGVYKAGFATTQDAYEAAVRPLFESLDWLEERLSGSDWLVGEAMTEADIRLFTTLVRFDAVYHFHFKCNVRRISDYPALDAYVARMLADPRIAATVHLDHIKTHYYASHRDLNPCGIVPVGPALPWAHLTAGGDQTLT
ncbi:glutathione S-transferase family protein [Sphingomonas sp. CFBP 13733]|uniref:glutathione S-transferase family protein n=1 Tax=Sphingomonas sp. CFBP 13733 TaxID=2775291 RepID=UPI00177C6027|nr:glutathione S-transferase family protein [Sphingomonas sp. CFBP 13733]MBD8640412.1 glutathione S-transferase family protein [Sphingomonas sp. CFBP 13733]